MAVWVKSRQGVRRRYDISEAESAWYLEVMVRAAVWGGMGEAGCPSGRRGVCVHVFRFLLKLRRGCCGYGKMGYGGGRVRGWWCWVLDGREMRV